MQQNYTCKLIYTPCHMKYQFKAHKLKIRFKEHKNLIFACKKALKILLIKHILIHLELFQQVSNVKIKLFKWSFGLRNKETKKSTLETLYFLENTI